MTVSQSEREYKKLVSHVLPHRIHTEEQNEEALGHVLRLMTKPNRTEAEDRMLDLLSLLVEDFESKAYATPSAEPRDVIEFLLDQRGLRPAALVGVFGSRGHVSDVLSGRKPITAEKARALGAFFNVEPGLFV